MPAPRPNTAGENPRSLFIVNAAKPMFTRSMNAIKYKSIMKGTMRKLIFRITRVSSSLGIRLLRLLFVHHALLHGGSLN